MEKKTNLDKMLYIMDRLGPAEVLAQMAEEASDLAQAALKYRRALTGKNPTPVSVDAADTHMDEEFGDVIIAYMVLTMSKMALRGNVDQLKSLSLSDEMKRKIDRWVARLEEAEG